MPDSFVDMPRETRRQSRKAWVWIMLMVNIVFLLLLMTLGIIALRAGNYLPETDIVFIVGKKTDVAVGDGEKPRWEANEEITVFETHYANGDNRITVESSDGEALIAPGTNMEYQFTMCNNSNVAVLYEIDLDMLVKLGGEVQGKELEEALPLQVRLTTGSGEYLIGEKDRFVRLSDALVVKKRLVLGAESFDTFTLELAWAYEGDDQNDTHLGDLSAEKNLTLSLDIDTFAEEHPDPEAVGGVKIDAKKETEIGGSIRWVWMLLLMINTAVMIFYVSFLMNKRLQKW